MVKKITHQEIFMNPDLGEENMNPDLGEEIKVLACADTGSETPLGVRLYLFYVTKERLQSIFL